MGSPGVPVGSASAEGNRSSSEEDPGSRAPVGECIVAAAVLEEGVECFRRKGLLEDMGGSAMAMDAKGILALWRRGRREGGSAATGPLGACIEFCAFMHVVSYSVLLVALCCSCRERGGRGPTVDRRQ